MKSLVLGAMMVGGSFLHAQVSDWCDTPTGHFGNPEAGVNSRVLLTITKGEEPNTVLLTLKPNAEAGNTVGLDYLYVTATNATPYPAVIGADGTEALGDLSVTLTFSEGTTQTDYMIQYSNPNWDGRWQIELKNVSINATCGDDVECELTQAPTMTSVSVDSYTHNTVVLNVAGTDEKGGAISRFLVSYADQTDKVFNAVDGKITIDGLSSNTEYSFSVKAQDICGNVSEAGLTVAVTTSTLIYHDFATGHLGDANFGATDGRILLTIQKESETSVSFTVLPNSDETIIDFINIVLNGVGNSIGDKTASVAGQKVTFYDLESLDNMRVNVIWHTPSVGAGQWMTNEFTVNESELYVAETGPSTLMQTTETKCVVYPNPIVDMLNVESEMQIAKAVLYNMMGQEVMTVASDANSVQLDCTALPQGSYMLNVVYVNGQKAAFKVIK